MRKIYGIIAASLAAAIASPAYADNNGYVEVRGGVAGGNGFSTRGTIGLALGYDANLSSDVFLGGELTADTDSSFDQGVYGLNARIGFQPSDKSKVFATVGYARAPYDVTYVTFPFIIRETGYAGYFLGGVGAQAEIGKSIYLSGQYQYYFDAKVSRGMIGLGYKF